MESIEPIPDSVLDSIEQLITEYLLRRKETVIQATIELYAGMVIGLRLEALVGISDIKKYHDFYEKYLKDKEMPYTGIWNKDWKYRLHGIGCELTHSQTKEHFDWDIGDPNFFALVEFLWHLKWRIQNNPSTDVNTYLAWTKRVERDEMELVFKALQYQNVLDYIEYDGERGEWGHAEWTFANPLFDYAKTYTMPRF